MPDVPEKKPLDVVLLRGKTDDGDGMKVLRITNRPKPEGEGDANAAGPSEGEGRIESGELRPLRDGKPLVSGEVVRLTQREEGGVAYDVEVAAKVDTGLRSESRVARPAQVASAAYRDSWERIFGPARELN